LPGQLIDPANYPVPAAIWDGIIPRSNPDECMKVVLFGDTSIGKSNLGYNLANAVAVGQPFLGRATTLTPTLYLGIDTPESATVARWLNASPPMTKIQFAHQYLPPFDICSPFFPEHPTFGKVLETIEKHSIKFLIIDALRNTHTRSMNDDDVPPLYYDNVTRWVQGCTVLVLHHTRKSSRDSFGSRPLGSGNDESMGSKYWTAYAQVGLFMQKENDSIISLGVTKSQVYEMPGPIRMIAKGGINLELYDDNRIKKNAAAWRMWETHCINKFGKTNWASYRSGKKVKLMEQESGMKKTTIYEWQKSLEDEKELP
jgi:hypothetical protein